MCIFLEKMLIFGSWDGVYGVFLYFCNAVGPNSRAVQLQFLIIDMQFSINQLLPINKNEQFHL